MAKSLRGYVGSIIKTQREFNEEYLKRVILVMLSMTKAEVIATGNNPNATCLELCIGAIIARVIKDGDMHRLGFLLDRALGKVTESVKIDLPPAVQYITEINSDGNLIQTVLKEEPTVLDVKPIKKIEGLTDEKES
jgi:hypothetical protein